MLEEAKLLEDDPDEKAARRTWGTSITIGGQIYATSLFWQPLQNQDDPFQEVEDASEGILEGADLFCIKPGKAPQFGICVSQEGFRSGEPVAAVALATALSDRPSFIAVFRTDEGWWYTCVRNDIILSDGDMLFLNEEEARNQFMSMLAVPDWGRRIAPKEWGVDDTEQQDLSELLPQGMRSKLQKIKALRGAKLLMVIGISTIVGLWLLSSLFNRMFLTPTVRPVVVPVKPKVISKVEEPPEIKPWENITNPATMMNECYKGIQSLVKIMPPGWEIGPIACTSSSVITEWSRKIGRLSWANKALNDSGLVFSGRSFSDNGDTLTVTLPLQSGQPIISPPIKTVIDLKNTLNDTFQTIGLKVVLGGSTATSPRGNIYHLITFKFTSTYNPSTWIDLLTKFSGLEIKNIKYIPNTQTWDYEGAIYAL